ncbi:MAG: diguanylate cyclase [Gammaproteobacteria bacterium]|nr:diguanylate cyclase [Gammaproteobacteria bacterium]
MDFGSARDLATIAKNLIEHVARPVEIQGKLVDVSTSIGIAVFDHPDLTGDDLMKSADTAMYWPRQTAGIPTASFGRRCNRRRSTRNASRSPPERG